MRQHLWGLGRSPSGCRAEPCREPRRLPVRRGHNRVQGRALPRAAQAARPARTQRMSKKERMIRYGYPHFGT